ncbi:MAG TPA: hypothetical protein VN647_03090 [Nitrospira sp.]|nr:hypothetical protein [Nitrospira sp.]
MGNKKRERKKKASEPELPISTDEPMVLKDSTATEGAIEECLDEINNFVMTLDQYPPNIVAIAMSVHLQTMLRTLIECDMCTPQQVREFIRELERDVFDKTDF